MNEAAWIEERNRELLEQVARLREHTSAEETPWSMSLTLLEEEIRQALDKQVAVIKSYEDKVSGLQASYEAQAKKVVAAEEAARSALEERASQLQTRIGEMEKLRDEEAYRVKKAMTFKDAEVERLSNLLGIDTASRRRRRIIWSAVGAVLAAALLVLTGIRLHESYFWRSRRYPLPYANPSAVTVFEGRIVISDWLTQCLYYHRVEEGLSVARVVFAPKYHFSGMAAEEGKLLATDKWERRIRVLSVRGSELAELSSAKSPGPRPSGLCTTEDALWSADPEARKLYRHNPELPEEVVKEYSLGYMRPRAVIRRGDRLWVLDDVTGKIYRNRRGADLNKIEAWQEATPGFPSGGPRPMAMAAGGGSLWILTTNPAGLVRHNLRVLERALAEQEELTEPD